MGPKALECAFIEVPWNHTQLQVRDTIRLRVARIRSQTFPTGKAVLFIAGGPGGSSVELSGLMTIYLPYLLDEHDFLFLDLRGTGGSGYLGCSHGRPTSEAEWLSCAGEHAGKPLQHHLTHDAATDIDFVRDRLGYHELNLHGTSYGTHVALEYLRRFGQHVTAAVLDGVVPPDYDYFSTLLQYNDRGLSRLIVDCEASSACKAVSPTLKDDLWSRREALIKEPRKVLIGGELFYETETTYLSLLNILLSSPERRFRIPRAIHLATAGNYALWNALIAEVMSATVEDTLDVKPRAGRAPRVLAVPCFLPTGQEHVAHGVFATVLCSETFALAGGMVQLKALASEQRWYVGDTLGLAASCARWDLGPIAAELQQPVRSDRKILLLSGDLDMVTPAVWGERALEMLSHGTHVVVPYSTHSTLANACAQQIRIDFIRAGGEIGRVDRSCLGHVTAPSW